MVFHNLRKEKFCGLMLAGLLIFCQTVFPSAQVNAAGANPAGRADNVTTSAAGSAQFTAQTSTQTPGNTYDLVLFFGQSNMVGEASHASTLFGTSASAIRKAAGNTGIAQDIILNTSDCATTYVPQQQGTAYWYSLTDHAVYELEPEQPIGTSVGGFTAVVFNEKTRQWETIDSLDNVSAAQWYSDQINMIPEFARTWYLKTGHKLIAIDCAVGGIPIQAYLPTTDPDYIEPEQGSIIQYGNLFQCVMESVDGVNHLAMQNGWNIAGRYFVSFQGEGNLYDADYIRVYQKVLSNWRELGFTQGALVQSAFTNNVAAGYPGVMQMHQWQETLVAEDNALTLGSSFAFDHYVPDKANYNSFWKKKWKNISWSSALTKGKLVTDNDADDQAHLNSAALSQIGRESALNLAETIH